MLKDRCILVDDQDNIVGDANKYDCHRFMPSQPQGLLHRAFSVFLFNNENKLLLQQRAKSKITFPLVWTNTCCSHPLYGQVPNEVDPVDAVRSGIVTGAKHAAVRKLEHELGIPASQLVVEQFKYLTRLHYCAADIDTHGPDAEWGEHEIDYILFAKASVDVTPNPDEVESYKYVSLEELKEMMQPSSGLKWSPWFRILATNFLEQWWLDLDASLTTPAAEDFARIHKL